VENNFRYFPTSTLDIAEKISLELTPSLPTGEDFYTIHCTVEFKAGRA
jgi:hypothetical protein